MIGWVNMHRHDEFSIFDGYGKPLDAAAHALSMGQTSLAIANHGSVSGLVEHYEACKKIGIKPILGCEVYFQPEFDKEKRSYHMCLFCKDLKGYQNLMKIISVANEEYFYRKPIVTYELLKKYHEGLVCSTACIAGWPSQAILNDNVKLARKRLLLLEKIFGEDFYVEIMPYHVVDNGVDLQLKCDKVLLKLINELDLKGIITVDSHYTRKEDYPTFEIMFKIAGKSYDTDYSQRYMPTEKEVALRFKKMYGKDPTDFLMNTKEMADKCNVELEFEEKIPHLDWGEDSKTLLKKLTRKGLKKKGKWDREHWEKCLYEFDVIFDLGFEDYFLLCWDIIKFALDNGIGYGRGRGSVCGSTVAYALNITDVDPLELGTIFERFLRKDKRKMPDIDMDFCSERRYEVIEYIYKAYEGRATQVAVYGYYKVDNLTNDLAKVLNIQDDEKKQIKDILNKKYPELVHGTIVNYEDIMTDKFMREMEDDYEFVTHFSKLCGQIRYIGKHAGGVAITYGQMTDQFAVIRSGGRMQSCYDLSNLDRLKVLKMDILGLGTVTINNELENVTGVRYSDDMYKDPEVIEEFKIANTTGIFQFDKRGAKDILTLIEPDNIQEVIAATAINRPAPLSMGIPQQFADAKAGNTKKTLASRYLPETHGCLVYQEDIFKIGKGLSDIEWSSIDKIMKGLKETTDLSKKVRAELKGIKVEFVNKAIEKHPKLAKRKKELEDLFELMTGGYLFNKGHAAGYILLSIEQMYFKHYYPLEFWATTLKYEGDDLKRRAYEAQAVREGCVIIPAHVNGPARYEIVEWGGGQCIQRGLTTIKGVGQKAAEEIQEKGPFLDRPEFEENVAKRRVNAGVIKALDGAGAFEFRNKPWVKKIIAENSALKNSTLQVR